MGGGDPGDQGLGAVPTGHPQQVRPLGHRPTGQGGHIHRAGPLQQGHGGPQGLGLGLEPEPGHLPPTRTRVHDQIRPPRRRHLVLQTPQRFPRAGSQSYPTPAAEANADGSTTIHLGPERPEGVAEGNWIQTPPRQGLVHHPAPVQPAGVVPRQDLAAQRSPRGDVRRPHPNRAMPASWVWCDGVFGRPMRPATEERRDRQMTEDAYSSPTARSGRCSSPSTSW